MPPGRNFKQMNPTRTSPHPAPIPSPRPLPTEPLLFSNNYVGSNVRVLDRGRSVEWDVQLEVGLCALDRPLKKGDKVKLEAEGTGYFNIVFRTDKLGSSSQKKSSVKCTGKRPQPSEVIKEIKLMLKKSNYVIEIERTSSSQVRVLATSADSRHSSDTSKYEVTLGQRAEPWVAFNLLFGDLRLSLRAGRQDKPWHFHSAYGLNIQRDTSKQEVTLLHPNPCTLAVTERAVSLGETMELSILPQEKVSSQTEVRIFLTHTKPLQLKLQNPKVYFADKTGLDRCLTEVYSIRKFKGTLCLYFDGEKGDLAIESRHWQNAEGVSSTRTNLTRLGLDPSAGVYMCVQVLRMRVSISEGSYVGASYARLVSDHAASKVPAEYLQLMGEDDGEYLNPVQAEVGPPSYLAPPPPPTSQPPSTPPTLSPKSVSPSHHFPKSASPSPVSPHIPSPHHHQRRDAFPSEIAAGFFFPSSQPAPAPALPASCLTPGRDHYMRMDGYVMPSRDPLPAHGPARSPPAEDCRSPLTLPGSSGSARPPPTPSRDPLPSHASSGPARSPPAEDRRSPLPLPGSSGSARSSPTEGLRGPLPSQGSGGAARSPLADDVRNPDHNYLTPVAGPWECAALRNALPPSQAVSEHFQTVVSPNRAPMAAVSSQNMPSSAEARSEHVQAAVHASRAPIPATSSQNIPSLAEIRPEHLHSNRPPTAAVSSQNILPLTQATSGHAVSVEAVVHGNRPPIETEVHANRSPMESIAHSYHPPMETVVHANRPPMESIAHTYRPPVSLQTISSSGEFTMPMNIPLSDSEWPVSGKGGGSPGHAAGSCNMPRAVGGAPTGNVAMTCSMVSGYVPHSARVVHDASYAVKGGSVKVQDGSADADKDSAHAERQTAASQSSMMLESSPVVQYFARGNTTKETSPKLQQSDHLYENSPLSGQSSTNRDAIQVGHSSGPPVDASHVYHNLPVSTSVGSVWMNHCSSFPSLSSDPGFPTLPSFTSMDNVGGGVRIPPSGHSPGGMGGGQDAVGASAPGFAASSSGNTSAPELAKQACAPEFARNTNATEFAKNTSAPEFSQNAGAPAFSRNTSAPGFSQDTSAPQFATSSSRSPSRAGPAPMTQPPSVSSPDSSLFISGSMSALLQSSAAPQPQRDVTRSSHVSSDPRLTMPSWSLMESCYPSRPHPSHTESGFCQEIYPLTLSPTFQKNPLPVPPPQHHPCP